MKTLIAYSSKYGTTKQCAEKIAASLEDSEIISVDDQPSIDINKYDQFIIGSSIYMGRLRKKMSQFLESNASHLNKKVVHLFVCCNDTTDYKSIFPQQVVKSSKSLTRFGFELKISEMKFFDRFITKKISGSSENVYQIKEDLLNNYTKNLSS